MLNREQRLMLFKARRTPHCLFSILPKEIIREIGDFGQDPNGTLHRCLKLVADGSLEKTKIC